ncbi:hypothetical protein BJX68DRAFT_241397 [Aspergillus pseudodeflectus]|uniref:Uncharacterized protein n=1 Tax=Aspergillus pseudodeflectus TaxID=176178 RepID=A0ABR4K1W5_9EURO
MNEVCMVRVRISRFELEAKQGWRRRLYHRKHAMGCLIQGPRTTPLRKAVPIYLLPTPRKIRPRPIMIIYDVSRSSSNRMDIWVVLFFFSVGWGSGARISCFTRSIVSVQYFPESGVHYHSSGLWNIRKY